MLARDAPGRLTMLECRFNKTTHHPKRKAQPKERITSVDPGGVQPGDGTNRQRPYKGRGDPVEPATVAKVKGSG